MKTDTEFSITPGKMAQAIDHTILKPDATPDDIAKICNEAVEYGFKAVCVNSGQIAHAAGILGGTGVEVCSVVGFPLGAMQARAKAYEAETAVKDGATELDMVLNIGALKSGDIRGAAADIENVRRAAGAGVILKVIIETCLLTDPEKIQACETARDAGADFVKTSTGFSTGGATLTDVALIRKTVSPQLGIKASGGIKSWSDALAMIKAGASRIGTSSGVEIVSRVSRPS
jgi:deoxyribose-phosphate aldolase